ncbi:MAG: calcium-binding protein, partial [Acidimicrobiales bacterium]
QTDVFVRDTVSGETSRVSVASDGSQANNGSNEASISANGRFVVFTSAASNLVAGDTNGQTDVFVRDTVSGETSRVSVASDGSQANRSSHQPSVSADGRLIAFVSDASNLAAGDTISTYDVFVRNTGSGETSRVSVDSGGNQAGPGFGSYRPSMSADGRSVAFFSQWPFFVAGDTNGVQDVFLKDLISGEITRVSVASDGSQSEFEGSFNPSISADGRFVAFSSEAPNLVAADTNNKRDIFVRDVVAGQTTRVSVATDGTQSNNTSDDPSLSADGRIVAFRSRASNLVAGDTNGQYDVFVRDTVSGETSRVSVAFDGSQTTSQSDIASVSADGRFVTFSSPAPNLVAADTNNAKDVFIFDRGSG